MLGVEDTPVEVCGFGLAQAGVYAMDAIRRQRPRRVLLAGCAGSYDASRAVLGTAVALGEVRCFGIGAGGKAAAELQQLWDYVSAHLWPSEKRAAA